MKNMLMHDKKAYEIIEALIAELGKRIPERALPLLDVPAGEQRMFIAFPKEGPPQVASLNVPMEHYEGARESFEGWLKRSGRFTEVLILSRDGVDDNTFQSLYVDFQRELTEAEIEAVELILSSCFTSDADALWVWGKAASGKTRLMVLQVSDVWLAYNEVRDVAIKLISKAGYQTDQHHVLLYFDLWLDSSYSQSAVSTVGQDNEAHQ